MIVMCQKDVSLKRGERLLEGDECWSPVRDGFRIRDDLKEVFVILSSWRLPKRTCGIRSLVCIIVDA
jgi:hypothetical protein